MTIFDEYKTYTGNSSISPSLLWEYDFYAAFNLYGGIEGFREIIKEVPNLSPMDMNFVCIVFNLKKEELKCYTRKQLRNQLLNS